MLFKLFVIFAVVPMIEIALFVIVGGEIGLLNTIAVVLLTAFLGAWLARAQGMMTLQRIQNSLAQGIIPADDMVDGALILAAGLVLLTPGFFTDALGFLILAPPTRPYFRRWLQRKFTELTSQGTTHITFRNF